MPMSDDPTIRGGENELALLDVPLLDLTLQVHRINLCAKGREKRWAGLHPSILAVLAGQGGTGLLGEGPLDVNASTAPLDIRLAECRRLSPPKTGEQAGEDERMPSGEEGLGGSRKLRPFFLREKGERPEALLVRPLADEEFEIARWVRVRSEKAKEITRMVAPTRF